MEELTQLNPLGQGPRGSVLEWDEARRGPELRKWLGQAAGAPRALAWCSGGLQELEMQRAGRWWGALRAQEANGGDLPAVTEPEVP